MSSSRISTAAIGATGLILGFAVAVASGSRPLGGLVLTLFGLTCVAIWVDRDGPRTALALTGVGLAAFVLSHLLGLLVGAWPAVLIAALMFSLVCRRMSDLPR